MALDNPVIEITEFDFNQIMLPVGFPVITVEDLSSGTMSDRQLQSLLIWPAMQEFFHHFPITTRTEEMIFGNFTIPFPDELTFGAADHRPVPQLTPAYFPTSNPFINAAYMAQGSQGSRGNYGTRYDYGAQELAQVRRAERQSLYDTNKSFKITCDKYQRALVGYCNMEVRLAITWAKFSFNFSDIPFQWKQDVVKLAQSNVLMYFGTLRQQSTAGLPVDISGDSFVEQAKQLKEEIMTKWENYTKTVIFRG